MIRTITPIELHHLRAAGQPVDLLDVRTAMEYDAWYIPGSRRVPLHRLTLESATANRPVPPDQPIYILCHSGGRSLAACHRLARAGFTNVVNVQGGITAWKRAGLPVESTRPPRNWRNILRIVGLLAVLAAIILAVTLHPNFAFVALALWIAMLLALRGCPLGACAVPTNRPRSQDSPAHPAD